MSLQAYLETMTKQPPLINPDYGRVACNPKPVQALFFHHNLTFLRPAESFHHEKRI